MIHFAYPFIILFGIPAFIIYFFVREKYRREIIYIYPLAQIIKRNESVQNNWIQNVLMIIKSLIFILLIFALARPQSPDTRTEIEIHGIDIVLALDISGSMVLFDDLKDQRSRIDVARQEAINFINKRSNDAVGLVIFGKEVLTRSPLTYDKKMLISILHDTTVGTLQSEGTMLSWGLAAAINRLKNSKAKSKVIIILTDGSPTDGDLDPARIVELARKLNIKIYTIGIGSQNGGMLHHPFYGIIQERSSALNKKLLSYIAHETGGQFFESQKPKDLEKIYNQIDKLEKTEYLTPIFQNYFELFRYLLILVLFLLALEIFLTTIKWTIL